MVFVFALDHGQDLPAVVYIFYFFLLYYLYNFFLILKSLTVPSEVVVIITNVTKPSVEFGLNTSLPQQITFGVSIQRLTERNTNREIINSIQLGAELNFTYDNKTFENSTNEIYTYSTVLHNGAIINITVSFLDF